MRRPWMFLVFSGACLVLLADAFQFPNLRDRMPLRNMSPGCAYKGAHYEHGERIPTPEPCLNCTCIRAVLVCYLRVCPTASAPPPGCFAAREPDECCASVICGVNDAAKSDNAASPELRPTFQPMQEETTAEAETEGTADSPDAEETIHSRETQKTTVSLETEKTTVSLETEKTTVSLETEKTTVSLETEETTASSARDELTTPFEQNETVTEMKEETSIEDVFSTALTTKNDSLVYITSAEETEPTHDIYNDIPRGCVVNGTIYGDGSAMISGSFCEYCFCIRGKTTCLKHKCNLEIDGCSPHYDSVYACCPSRYNCSQRSTMTTTVSIETTTETPTTPLTTTVRVYPEFRDCIVNGETYREGDVVPDYIDCHNCYCSNTSIVCNEIKCSPPLEGCRPIIPAGSCCPISYRCDYHSHDGDSIKKNSLSNSESDNKRNDIKAVKNYAVGAIEPKQKSSNNYTEFTSLLHNVIPISRRLDENLNFESNLTANEETSATPFDSADNNDKVSSYNGSTTDILYQNHENDKTVDIARSDPTIYDKYDQSTARTIFETDQVTPNYRTSSRADDVSVGIAEIHKLSIQQLFDKFFRNRNNSSTIVPEFSHEHKRNNSKQPSSIVELDVIETKQPKYESTTSSHTLENKYTSFNTDPTTLLPTYSHKLEDKYTSLNTDRTKLVPTVLTTSPSYPITRETSSNFFPDKLEASHKNNFPFIKLNAKPIVIFTTNKQGDSVPAQTSPSTTFTELTDVDEEIHTASPPYHFKETSSAADYTSEWTETQETSKEEENASTQEFDQTSLKENADSSISTSPSYLLNKISTNESFNTDIPTSTKTETQPSELTDAATLYDKLLRDQTETSTEMYGTTDRILETDPAVSETTYISKASTRINSKLPSFNSLANANDETNIRHPLLTDSVVHVYDLPQESREEAFGGKDFENVGSIYLGAPLAVGGTDIRKGTGQEKYKLTQSDGVIFMDPKYTDISNSDQNVKVLNGESGNNLSVSDQRLPSNEPKKGPRIQDPPIHPNARPGFRIIPFVAEDAVRGQLGKMNGTLPVQQQGPTDGLPDIVSDFCFVRGRIFVNGETIGKPDPCELCRCFYGRELCQIQKCPIPPSDCTPEKVPGFCCPRFTCAGNNHTHGQSNKETRITSTPLHAQVQASTLSSVESASTQQNTNPREEVKYGNRVRPRPISTSTTSTTTRVPATIFTSPKFEDQRPSTTKKPTILSTSEKTSVFQPQVSQKPEVKTTTTQSSLFPDPWGLLKVSGCNIYGRYFNINDQVEILSGPCSHCICTTNGVECNDIC